MEVQVLSWAQNKESAKADFLFVTFYKIKSLYVFERKDFWHLPVHLYEYTKYMKRISFPSGTNRALIGPFSKHR